MLFYVLFVLYFMYLCVNVYCHQVTTQLQLTNISYHIYHFPGWGRGWRRVVSDWYLKKEPMEMSECVTKFRGRYGWTHRDIVRLSHLKSANVGNDGLCCEI